ncbi:GntR family transcriptional regulator [Cryptosporangium aurantiacum]|uniref:GntR family transcriptional regulator n=1 Tax=Cryptosporangium aurantiacum TaxID=134849 RepID=A0A1M7QMY7_9ACTN|nr:GntR family transcriptional regulator [Cryptosporangium aurantiacum]SHN32692.1 GntR family transcriptional regulator [Cryptosporangium aurantiacum]
MAAVNGEQPQRPDQPARSEQSPYHDQPQYQVIANDLRARIQRRELPPGAQVPTEKDLAATYGCSRNTVRMALSALANEGLISAGRARAGRTVRRREQFVLTHRVEDELGAARLRGPDSFADQAHRLGRTPTQKIEVAIVAAGPEYGTRLEVPADERLVVRRRVRFLDDTPSHLSESFYPLALVKDTPVLDPEEIVPSVVPLLAALGHRQVRFVDEIIARMPDPYEVRLLEIGIGVPVIEHLRTGWSPERPVRLTRTVLPSDRHQLRYELPG